MTVVSKLLLLIFALSKFEVARTDCNQSKCFTWRDHKEDFFCEGSAFETYGCYTKKNNVTVELLTYDCSFNIKCFFDDQTPHQCQLNSPVYKFMNSLVNFVFRITDNITNSTTYACINHLKTVKNIPEYVLKANSSEPNRIKVCLSGAGAMASIEPGTFELGYICKECEIKERFPNTNNFFIEDLPYAFYNYSFEFQFRYKGSNYSKTVTKYFNTAAKKPETIPSQEHFLFSLDGKENTGNLFLYWDSLEEKFHNGPGFKYKITKDSGQSVLTYISNIDWGSIPLNKTSIFYLQSCNNIGCSDKNATLLIHPRNPKYELHVWSISISNDFNNYNNYTRFVRWWFPNTAEVVLISNTTIVHTKVPPGFNQHFFKLSKETDLNSKLGVIGKFADCDYSTGIVWDECRDSNKILNNEDIIPALEYSLDGHLRKLRIRLENLECWHKAAIDYIEIEYWEDQILNKNAKNITNLVDEIVLEKLTPFTNYSVKLKVHSSITTFKESEIKNVITLEDFKNPPRNLRLVGSNNTSIQLAWEAPIQVNSSNIKYIVNYNGTRHDAGNEGNFIVNNLDCNKTYEFWITTLGYNNKSNIIYEVLRCYEPICDIPSAWIKQAIVPIFVSGSIMCLGLIIGVCLRISKYKIKAEVPEKMFNPKSYQMFLEQERRELINQTVTSKDMINLENPARQQDHNFHENTVSELNNVPAIGPISNVNQPNTLSKGYIDMTKELAEVKSQNNQNLNSLYDQSVYEIIIRREYMNDIY